MLHCFWLNYIQSIHFSNVHTECRYLGQLLGDTDEADQVLGMGIDILKEDILDLVRTLFLEVFIQSHTHHLSSLCLGLCRLNKYSKLNQFTSLACSYAHAQVENVENCIRCWII